MTTLLEAAGAIQRFERGALTARIAEIEAVLRGCDKASFEAALTELSVEPVLLDAAFAVKRVAGQIDVLIHTVGILLSLPHILQQGEVITSLSLGAGNTGRPFDVETNVRVAEFKFINWRGGAESVRQNSLFKDFYLLAEYDTPKQRFLYVVGTKHPLKFLNGRRSLESVMSRDNRLWSDFQSRYGQRFTVVCEYYQYRSDRVRLVDISSLVPQFAEGPTPNIEEAEP